MRIEVMVFSADAGEPRVGSAFRVLFSRATVTPYRRRAILSSEKPSIVCCAGACLRKR
jgi:hypothetical protein